MLVNILLTLRIVYTIHCHYIGAHTLMFGQREIWIPVLNRGLKPMCRGNNPSSSDTGRAIGPWSELHNFGS